MRNLRGAEKESLWRILLKGHSLKSLTRMLAFKLEVDLGEITSPGPLQDVVFELIEVSEMEGWTYKLILAAREARPDDPDLIAFAQRVGVAPLGTPQQAGLEKMIVATNASLDIMEWRTALSRIEGQVCRVELSGRGTGTGFLIGPDLVLTNWHVVNGLTGELLPLYPAGAVLRFDYKRLADGVELNRGKEYRLVMAEDAWLADHSPWSPVDLCGEPKPGSPTVEELDFALLRVDGAPGSEPIGEKPEVGGKARGWISLPDTGYDFQVDTPLFIVQHPRGAPLQLALDTRAVEGVYGNGTRVRYRTNTEPGSSGSPVFDQNWNLVAVHHSGDPSSGLPTYNEGVPIHLIADRLRAKGLVT
jgi:hypothetical protein